MINLDDLQGTRHPERSGNGRCRLHDFLFSALPGALLKIDIRCFGKGRKERVTPLTKILSAVLKRWLDEPRPGHSNILFPTMHGCRMSLDAVHYLVAKYVKQAAQRCRSLRAKRISPHVLRHSAAMELLVGGVDSTVISLWLGHESTRSTQAYLHAYLAIKEAALAKVEPLNEQPFRRFKADDKLLLFLDAL
ncbi:tyrosine-type recombinase/integrase [Rhizobium lusitanum]|uniref:Tyrosine-type recombinase/integrase n=1 Tax=Rhizobium lusitanum TaxID=293958 RepID=A0A6L9UFD0_9HYPH|nr:tyrosine-type recombinase/integrase [Rhizobium lusitanum]NEI74364.1 tyrosine-type recombinase/integrase [Rhizobium lusitanum]